MVQQVVSEEAPVDCCARVCVCVTPKRIKLRVCVVCVSRVQNTVEGREIRHWEQG